MRGLGKSTGVVVIALLVGYLVGASVTRREAARAAGVFDAAKIVHVGVIVKDVDKASANLAKILGIPAPKPALAQGPVPFAKDLKADPNAVPKFIQIPFGNTVIELLEPRGGVSPWRNHLEKHNGGLHHIAFGVPDLDAAVGVLTKNGAKVEFMRPGMRGYVNADDQVGFTFEVFQNAK